MNELKPCPFCGGEAFINLERDCRWVECRECGAMGYVEIGCGKAEAIAVWNTRADDYRQAAEYWQRMYEEAFAERTCDNCAALNKAAGLWAKADKRARDLERTYERVHRND